MNGAPRLTRVPPATATLQGSSRACRAERHLALIGASLSDGKAALLRREAIYTSHRSRPPRSSQVVLVRHGSAVRGKATEAVSLEGPRC
jgi:hypothetical protein